MVETDAGNAKVLRDVLAHHRPTGHKMIDAGSRLLASHAPASRAEDIADRVVSGREAFLGQTGIGAPA